MQKLQIVLTTRNDIKEFIETNHYSHNINGVISDYCFKVLNEEGNTLAAAIFGRLAMRGQYKKYSENEEDVIELRRFVAVDETERNFESYVLSRMFKLLPNHIKMIVSYSDPHQGHVGTIYKALNFKYLGQVPAQKVILYQGKTYHDKSIRTMYNGKLKPFALKLRDALQSGEAEYIKVPGKMRYLYTRRLRKQR